MLFVQLGLPRQLTIEVSLTVPSALFIVYRSVCLVAVELMVLTVRQTAGACLRSDEDMPVARLG